MKYFTFLFIIISFFSCGKQITKQETNNKLDRISSDEKPDTISISLQDYNFYDEYIKSNLDSIDNLNFLREKFKYIQNLNNNKMYKDAYYTSLNTLMQLKSGELNNSDNIGLKNAIFDEMNFSIQMNKKIKNVDNLFDIYSTGYTENNKNSIPKDSIIKLINKMEFPDNFDIVINDDVIKMINKFLTTYKSTLIRWNENKTIYDEKITSILLSFNIPHEIIYIAMIESGYKYSAISKTKAVGMWQFMPKTAKGLGASINYWEDDRKDFIKATYLASNYLSYLYSKYNNWLLAFAAYNCGGKRVDKLLTKHRGRSIWDIYPYLPKETRNYVTSFLAVTLLSENLDKLGIKIKQKNGVDYKTVIVEGGILMSYIARCSDTTTTAIKRLNPQFKLGATPTTQNEVIVKIPSNKYDTFVKKYKGEKKVRKKGKIIIVTHTVRHGDSLYKLARIYKTSVDKILSANTIKNARKIKPGMKIVIPVPVSAIR